MADPKLRRLESWVESFQPRVYKAACLILRDPVAAQDVAQETFLRAWNAMGRVGEDADIERWLCRISVNLCLNQIRSRRREQDAVGKLGADGLRTAEDLFEVQATRSAVDEAMRRLPERLRVPVILRYYLDLPDAEVAKALSLRTGTVKSRLHEARRLLAEDRSVAGTR